MPDHRIAIDVDGRFWHAEGHLKTRGSTNRDLRKLQAFSYAGWRLVRVREAPLPLLGPYDLAVEDLRTTRAVVVTLAEHLVDRFELSAPGLDAYRKRRGLAARDVADALLRKYEIRTVAGRTLADLHPMVAAEWHPTRNGILRPDAVFAGSARKVWWLCAVAGHEWDASLLNRSQGTGCPYCSGNRAGQGNTLADRRPDLAAQWHATKNGDLRPDQVTPGTRRKAHWRCISGHEWEASIASRSVGRGCPRCAGRKDCS
ncbi:MAG: hypothetical protein JWO67_3448 [Streptosporangiaceae bacterium]|nr:hypothetical protein [Streptosporangiaceae bacterium]